MNIALNKKNNMVIAFLKPNPFHHKFRERIKEWNLGGEYNGYVAFDKKLPLSWQGGASYDDHTALDELVDVHGGITLDCPLGDFISDDYIPLTAMPDEEEFKKLRVIGFDTLHAGDTKERWNEEAVMQETFRLMKQIEEL